MAWFCCSYPATIHIKTKLIEENGAFQNSSVANWKNHQVNIKIQYLLPKTANIIAEHSNFHFCWISILLKKIAVCTLVLTDLGDNAFFCFFLQWPIFPGVGKQIVLRKSKRSFLENQTCFPVFREKALSCWKRETDIL